MMDERKKQGPMVRDTSDHFGTASQAGFTKDAESKLNYYLSSPLCSANIFAMTPENKRFTSPIIPEPQDLASEAITELEAMVDDLKDIVELIEKEEGAAK
jgi:hypothetical protein